MDALLHCVSAEKRAGIIKLIELLFFPSFCRTCSSLLENAGERVVCRQCLAEMHPYDGSFCIVCGRFFAGSAVPHICSSCLQEGPLWTRHRSCCVYQGRIKDLIVLSSGHNIPPQELESRLKASPHIMDAVVIGEGKPYLTALIVIDEEIVGHYAQAHAIPFSTFADLSQKPEIVRLIDAEVRQVNRDFAARDQVRCFRVLKWELNREEEELTPTMKVRRSFLCARYADEIEEMYRKTQA